ncbi:MAG: hypothetical protein ACI8Z5_000872 [Lentimonas sp.]|jgi:hypothetical protein
MDTSETYTVRPAEAGEQNINQPEFVRLPRAGQRCPLTGIELVLASDGNGFKPPVRSVSLRKPGNRPRHSADRH